ncbi:MAG: DUF502 domain-containing protein [Parachlamydiaceae bacterium]|nr:DUF502 domain-containing protein [Parachlamydiaceae bacterium]
MKKHFITGLVILLPLTLTFFFVGFVFNLLTDPFVGLVQSIFHYFNLFESGFGIFSADQVKEYASKVCTVVFLVSFTIILGAVARWYFINYLLSVWNYILHRIPFVNVIYKTSQDVINTIFSSKTSSFKQVVLAPFPHPDSKSMGFVTCDDLPSLLPGGESNVTVFVPTTPNPTSGFLVFFAEKDLIYLDMKIEDAFKYIISCGVVPATLNIISKIEATDSNRDITFPEKKNE